MATPRFSSIAPPPTDGTLCALATLAMARRESTTGRATGPGQGWRVGRDAAGAVAAGSPVSRTGVNLNQAVAPLNATGQPPVWLEHAINRLTRAVACPN